MLSFAKSCGGVLTALLLCFVFSTSTARAQGAQTITVTSADFGAYTSTGTHDPRTLGITVGTEENGTKHRSFLLFNLPPIAGNVTGVTLTINNQGGRGVQRDYILYDVSTPLSALAAGGTGRTDIYNDLGTGTTYGSTPVTPPNVGPINFTLNAAAIAAIQSASGGAVAIGADFPGNPGDILFGGTLGTSAGNVRAVQLTITTDSPQPVASAGDVVFSEFRFRGSFGEGDEFVELRNNSEANVLVQTTDGSTGWSVVSSAGTVRFTVLNGFVIPKGGHYLAGGGNYAFTLGNYPGGLDRAAARDTQLFTIPAGSGIALFRTSNSANFTLPNRLDAVGFSGVTNPLYFETTGLGPEPAEGDVTEYSFVRKTNLTTGSAQDTNDNAADFVLVATDPSAITTTTAILGAPGPENLSAPTKSNAQIKASLINPAQAATAPPNRVRSGQVVANGAYGTLSIQRKFTNTSDQPVTRLRFRVVDITTLNSPGYAPGNGQADLRVLNSSGTVTNSQGATLATVTGLTLETPPQQALGGGLNSSLTVIPPGGVILPGNSLEVQFLLGVQQEGSFRFFVNVEAVPGPANVAAAPNASAAQTSKLRKDNARARSKSRQRQN